MICLPARGGRRCGRCDQDGIGKGGLADEVVPCFHRELAGDQRRAAAVAILDNLHEITPLAGVEAVGAEVVKHEQIDFSQGTKLACEAAVAMGTSCSNTRGTRA
jgi:hypothetical protein